MAGDVNGARQTLRDGYNINNLSEDIYLAAVKLEIENEEYARARKLLERARNSACSAKVIMKWAKLEWYVRMVFFFAVLKSKTKKFSN